jgi:Cu2+-exporting ATPase
VVGGTVLYEGPLTVRSTATGQQSTLAGIGRLVAEAQSREAPVQRLADAVAGKFCYGVMAASAATFAFWQTLGTAWWPWAVDAAATGGGEVPGSALLLSIKLAVDVLVVACPCALGLATPTAVLVGSSLGATHGLLLRGGDVLERIAGVNAVVFDKTGTLTTGQLRLEGVDLLTGSRDGGAAAAAAEADVTALLQAAAAVESATRHPLAAAVNAEVAARGLTVPPVQDASTAPGYGVQGTLEDGQQVLVGKFDWVLGQLSPEAVQEARQQLRAAEEGPAADAPTASSSSSSSTRVLVARGGRVLGVLRFGDQLRADAAAVVGELQQRGIK